MSRTIGAVVVGYVVMFVVVFVSFSAAYGVLGTEGSFQPGSYEVNSIWLVLSFVLGLVAAIAGGYVCMTIARDPKAATYLAAFVFILGILLAVPAMLAGYPGPVERGPDVGNLEAMQYARQPIWVMLLNPIIGAAGVMVGARMKKGA